MIGKVRKWVRSSLQSRAAAELSDLYVRESNYVKCHLCGNLENTKFELISSVERYNIRMPTYRCCECNLVAFRPFPNYTFLEKFYSVYYQKFHRRAAKPNKRVLDRETQRASRLIDMLSSLNVNPRRVMDVGCSAGNILFALHKEFPEILVSGIEPDSSYAEFARERLPGSTIYTAMLEDAKIDETYDLVLFMHVLEHIGDVRNALAITKSILDPGGLLYVETPNFKKALENGRRYSDFLLISKLYSFTPNTLERLLEDCGFEVIALSEQHKNHFQLVAKVKGK